MENPPPRHLLAMPPALAPVFGAAELDHLRHGALGSPLAGRRGLDGAVRADIESLPARPEDP